MTGTERYKMYIWPVQGLQNTCEEVLRESMRENHTCVIFTHMPQQPVKIKKYTIEPDEKLDKPIYMGEVCQLSSL